MPTSNISVSLAGFEGAVMPLTADPPRPVYVYRDGARTSEPRVSEISGRPLFKLDGLFQLSATQAVPVALLIDSPDPLPLMEPVALDRPRSMLRVRPDDQYSLSLTIEAVLAAPKAARS